MPTEVVIIMRWWRKSKNAHIILVCLSALILLTGAAIKPKHVYTGIFGLWGWGNWDEAYQVVKDGGFQLVIIGPTEDQLNKTHAHGLKGIVSFGLTLETVKDENKWKLFQKDFRRCLEEFKNHPAVYAWYPVDEPDYQKIPPDKIRILRDIALEVDPIHPLFTTITRAASWNEYLPYFDIIAIDRYLTINRVGIVESPQVVKQALVQLKAELLKNKMNKSVWIVIGAFELKPRPDVASSSFHKPSTKEYQEMIDVALGQDVDGILVYTLAIKGNPKYIDWNLVRDDSQLWNTVKSMNVMIQGKQ